MNKHLVILSIFLFTLSLINSSEISQNNQNLIFYLDFNNGSLKDLSTLENIIKNHNSEVTNGILMKHIILTV